jgi:hypothetical protein
MQQLRGMRQRAKHAERVGVNNTVFPEPIFSPDGIIALWYKHRARRAPTAEGLIF